MQFLSTLLHLPREVWIGAGVGAAIAFLVCWALIHAGRRRYVTVNNSPATEYFAFQLGRIADALERVSIEGVRETPQPARSASPSAREAVEVPLETQRPAPEAPPGRHISMSMFGR